jgi:ribulose-phosphate 3-epimerase
LSGAGPSLRGGKKFLLAPSILSADPLAIGDSITRLKGEHDWIHVDVMDGRFVPNLSYGPQVVSRLRESLPDSFIDVHIMAEPAESFIDMFVQARPDLITLHAEAARHVHMALGRLRSLGVRPGIAINPGTPLCMIEPVLHLVDLVLVMSVNPGFGGQRFIPETLPKVRDLVRLRAVRELDYVIEMDGGIGADNAGMLVSSGCDVLVAGSAVFGCDDPAEAAARIRRAAEGGDAVRPCVK